MKDTFDGGIDPAVRGRSVGGRNFSNDAEFTQRLNGFLKNRPGLSQSYFAWREKGRNERHLLSLLRGHRMKRILNASGRNQNFYLPTESRTFKSV